MKVRNHWNHKYMALAYSLHDLLAFKFYAKILGILCLQYIFLFPQYIFHVFQYISISTF